MTETDVLKEFYDALSKGLRSGYVTHDEFILFKIHITAASDLLVVLKKLLDEKEEVEDEPDE